VNNIFGNVEKFDGGKEDESREVEVPEDCQRKEERDSENFESGIVLSSYHHMALNDA
jgi:hypothetical protein